MDNITAREAYRRSNARDLVETMLENSEHPEDFNPELIIDALLEADPNEREFDFVDAQGFWEIANAARTGVVVRISRTGYAPHVEELWPNFTEGRRAVLRYARENGLWVHKLDTDADDSGLWNLYTDYGRKAANFYGTARVDSTS